jgi:hypothetical protein
MTEKKKTDVEQALEWIDDVLGLDDGDDARDELGMVERWAPPRGGRNPWPKWDKKFVIGLGKLCKEWVDRTNPERREIQERIRENQRREKEEGHDQHSLVSKYGYGIKKE